MIERLKSIISQMGLSDRAFALKCGIAQNTLSRQLSGAREVSLATISAVLENNPEISAEWLLRGKGEMLLKTDQPTDKEGDRIDKLIDTIAFQQDTINNLQAKIKELEEKILTANNQLKIG